MRKDLAWALVPVLWGQACWAQQPAAPEAPNDFKPASTNIVDLPYPQVHSAGEVKFHIYAPDANSIRAALRTIPDREHRATAGLSRGGFQTYQITPANLDKCACIGVFSAPFGFPGVENEYNGLLAKPEEFAKQVKVFYISMGSQEGARTGRSIHEAPEQAGVKRVYYEAPGGGHEFQTWRKSLHGFAQFQFQD